MAVGLGRLTSMELLVRPWYRSLSKANASGFAERLQDFGGVHASGLEQVDGRRPYLSDE